MGFNNVSLTTKLPQLEKCWPFSKWAYNTRACQHNAVGFRIEVLPWYHTKTRNAWNLRSDWKPVQPVAALPRHLGAFFAPHIACVLIHISGGVRFDFDFNCRIISTLWYVRFFIGQCLISVWEANLSFYCDVNLDIVLRAFSTLQM